MRLTLPPVALGLKRITNKYELFRLIAGRRSRKTENLEPDIGKQYIIVSPFGNTRYVGTVQEYTAWDELERMINEGNVFLF